MLDIEHETPASSRRPEKPCAEPTTERLCDAVEHERARRKASDRILNVRLGRIERNSRVIMAGIGAMILSAALEYGGIIGKNADHTVWSHSIITGLRVAIGGSLK
jgi:hypothetical protein